MPSGNYDAQEMELNLADMFWAIMMKWRALIICGILFAILAGGVSYIKSVKQIEAEKQATTQEIKLEGEALDNAEDYLAYWELYKKQKEYNENSLMMQLDGNRFYKATLSYYIDNKYILEYPEIAKSDNIAAFTNQYISYLECDEFYDKLPDAADNQDKKAYYSEAIDFLNQYGGGKAIRIDANLLTIAVYHENREECLAIAQIIDEIITEKQAEVTQLLGEHEVIQVRNECILTADDDLLEYQNKNFVAQNTQRVNMNTMEKNLTKNELAYVSQKMQEERDSIEAEGEALTQAEEGLQNVSPSISKKLVVVGFLAGVILAAGVAALAYLFRAKLHMRDDFERLYGVKLLGNVVYDKRKKKLFGFVDRLLIKLRDCRRHYFKEEEICGMIAAGVRIAAAKADTDKVFVTGTNLEGKGKEFIKKLDNLLKKDNITMLIGNNILYDPAALEKLVETGHVVLVEEAEKSLYDEIRKEIETCRYHKIDVIGAVVISMN